MNKTSSSEEIAIFVRVAETGGFAAAAEELGLTPSGASKAVTRLEDRLGVRLMQRTTRRLVLTGEGETLLTRGREILASIEAAEAEVTIARGKPRGLLKVNTGTAYAKHHLAPLLPEFRDQFPEISLELSIADRRIDVIGEQIDVAIRTGGSGDSSLITRRIGTMRRIICASPAYLALHGTPIQPADLARHNCLLLTGFARLAAWPMRVDGRVKELNVKGTITCDSAELLLDMTIAGLGISRFGDFLAADALAKGQLVPLLVDDHVVEDAPISALMPPGRQHLPRVRAFVDFLATRTGQPLLPHS
jgi:DNA-binding transcriptional LysR family regulator